MFDADLARRAIKEIENNPERWKQRNWFCQTGQCFAGFVAELSGADFTPVEEERRFFQDSTPTPYIINPDTGYGQHVADYAAHQLGFEDYDHNFFDGHTTDADRLFNENNTVEDLHRLVDEIAEGQ